MSVKTICPKCGAEYDEPMQEVAADPLRLCPPCFKVAHPGYEAPTLTAVGNVRELLRGEGGSIADMDPSGLDPQQSSRTGP